MPTSHPGRNATDPGEIPASGWWQITKRVLRGLGHQRIGLISAGMAFYMFLSLIPTLASLLTVYGLIADPAEVRDQVAKLSGILPPDVVALLDREMARVTGAGALAGWSLVITITIAIWGASKAMNALVIAVNIAYREEIALNFIKQRFVSLILTVGSIIFSVLVLIFLAVIPAGIRWLPLTEGLQTTLSLIRWPLLLVTSMIWLAVIYRFAPHRRGAKWKWITRGSAVAGILWVLASVGLTYGTSHFFDYSATYGSLGAILLILLWFHITGYVLLIGALLNAETEHQTKWDTTIGEDRPIGKRGAFVADHTAGGDEDPFMSSPNPIVEGLRTKKSSKPE